MLSNPNTNLHQRQRQHRRQNSTPTVFETTKVPLLPAKPTQRQGPHRRRLSLDHRSPHRRQAPLTPQDDITHTLREAQQHKLARPGQQQQERQPHLRDQTQEKQFDLDTQERHDGGFKIGNDFSNNALYFDQQNQTTTFVSETANRRQTDDGQRHRERPLSYSGFTMKEIDDFLTFADGYVEHDQLSHNNQGDLQAGAPSNRIESGRYERRRSLQPNLYTHQQRPTTPQNASSKWRTLDSNECFDLRGSDYFPLTPATTPYKRIAHTEPPIQSVQIPPASRDDDATIRASPTRAMQRGRSCIEFFNELQLGSDQLAIRPENLPSPPHTAPLVSASTFDSAPMPNPSFMNMTSLKLEFSGSENGYESSHYSPKSSAHSPTMSSLRSSPGLAHVPLLETMVEEMPDVFSETKLSLSSSQSGMSSSTLTSPVRDNFLSRITSTSDLDPDAPEETGITIDEIAAFISGPDQIDGKWVCLFPDCNGRFGRKENIKSHVQTHLGDRQYRCKHCNKCFVRQHDLKRHEKIHSGVKPYPCLCGNSFARHDALTRHRQRGNCIGAFDGVVKKVTKRGRPKKARPDTEERLEKAARTRKRAIAKSYASSTSGSSECSYPRSPRPEYDNPSNRASSPLDSLQPLQKEDFGFSSDVFSYTPPTTPGHYNGCVSPQHTQYSSSQNGLGTSSAVKRESVTSLPETLVLPSDTTSPGKSNSSQYGTPPELCIESSSPAASRFFDFDGDLQPRTEGTAADKEDSKVEISDLRLPDINEDGDQMFLDTFTADAGLTLLERDPDMLLLEKFEDPFNGEDLFSDNYMGSSDDFFNTS
ncbi:MAG: hypothetical protein M1835_006433 [Candelina submexicana]|nr:MAG: hypothetical protein M1835_006433 [Candelina submexicana]